MIDLSTNTTNDVIGKWTTQELLQGIGSGEQSSGFMAARNYAFIAYVEHNYGSALSADDRKALDSFKNSATFTDMYASGVTNPLTTTLQGYRDEYMKDQASIDALAFVGLMDTASKTFTGSFTDNDAIPQMRSVVSAVTPVLTKAVSKEELQSGDYLSAADGKYARIEASKIGDRLNIVVYPGDLDPREGDKTNVNDTPDIKYITQVYASYSGRGASKKTVVSPNSDGSGEITTIDLSMTEPNNVCTVTPSSDYFTSVSLQVESGDAVTVSVNTITAQKAGTATVKIIGTMDGGETCEGTVTVIVH